VAFFPAGFVTLRRTGPAEVEAEAEAPASPSLRRGHQSASLYRTFPFALGAAIARAVPLPFLRRLGAVVGALYAWTHPVRVAVVLANLRLLDVRHNSRAARRVFASFGMTMADYFHIGTRPPHEAARLIARTDGEEHLREVQLAGKGALLVTAHLGLFELGGLATALSGFPCTVVSLPEPSPGLTSWRNEFRAGWGVETIDVGTGPFSCFQIADRLRSGGCVAALIDRPRPDDPDRATLVSVPQGMAPFTPDILLVAMQCGAPVLPAAMLREADGTYRATIFPPFLVEDRGDRAETLRHATQHVADQLFPLICSHPEQWYQFVPLS
jgi:KDO2-lipid IV(A) lauroyltransferase